MRRGSWPPSPALSYSEMWAPDQPGLAVADLDVGVADRRAALAHALHLGALQHDAGLDALEDLVLVQRAAVTGDVAKPLVTPPPFFFLVAMGARC